MRTLAGDPHRARSAPRDAAARDVRLVASRWFSTPAVLPVAFFAVITVLASWSSASSLALIAAGCLALLLLAGVAAHHNLEGLGPIPPAPMIVRAGHRLEVDLELRAPRTQSRGRDLILMFNQARGRAGTGHLEGLVNGEARAQVPIRYRARGHVDQLTLDVTSTYPFGLFGGLRRFQVDADILVLPQLGRVLRFDQLLAQAGGDSTARARRGLGDGDYEALREWRPGLPLRGVHWKLSARRGRVLLREFSREEEHNICIVLVREWPARSHDNDPDAFERAVSLSATLLREAARRGMTARLAITPGSSTGLESRSARRSGERRGQHALELEHELASVTALGEELPETIGSRPHELTLAICAAGPTGATPGLEGGPGLVLNVDDPDIGRWFEPVPGSAAAVPRGVYA